MNDDIFNTDGFVIKNNNDNETDVNESVNNISNNNDSNNSDNNVFNFFIE